MKISTGLTKAASILNKRGLAKGQYSSHGRVCVSGACNLAFGGIGPSDAPALPTGAYLYLNVALGTVDTVSENYEIYLEEFNDRPETTKADVIEVIKLAAKLAKADGK